MSVLSLLAHTNKAYWNDCLWTIGGIIYLWGAAAPSPMRLSVKNDLNALIFVQITQGKPH